ncbi:MAG: DUF411 domain-containing protein [Gemmatimonadaceae bacterium]
MKKRSAQILALAATLVVISMTTAAVRSGTSVPPAKKPTITVYKDPSCGCCKNWIAYLAKHGYTVDAKDTPNMTEIKHSLGVPPKLTACHTGVVDGYLIEGHVSAEDIDRLLAQKPRIAGIAVPGMPMSSPGMDGPRSHGYQVMSFDKQGKTKVFANH